jgi:ribosomally synthesized peptide (two-chain TOMM family)
MRYVQIQNRGDKVELHAYSSRAASEGARSVAADPGLQSFGPEDAFKNVTALRDWQSCWLRVIGLVWRDPELKPSLLADPAAFFQKHCNYTVVPTMRIEVAEDLDSSWHYDEKDQSTWTVRPSVLRVFLPQPPKDQEDFALAVADFEAVSTLVPFSFTC